MKRIISLDVSSSTIGWAYLEENDDKPILLEYGHIKPPTKEKAERINKGFSYRLSYADSKLHELFEKYQPTEVIVEDYAKKFSKGKSSANTIIVLATFNEVISLCWFKWSGKEVYRMPVATIRKIIRNKFDSDVKEKESVLKFVNEYFDKFEIVKNKKDNIKKEVFDESDAIIVGVAYLLS